MKWYIVTLISIATAVFSALAVSMIYWIIGQLRRPVVLVHEAILLGPNEPCYFIKIINRSDKKDFTITHVWIEDKSKNISIINEKAPLPKKISPSDIYETWIKISEIKEKKELVYKKARVRLSYGRVLKSKFNKGAALPGKGMISNNRNPSNLK